MMKKLIAILLFAALCLSFSACGGNGNEIPGTSEENTSTSATEEITTENHEISTEIEGLFPTDDPLSNENLEALRKHGLFTESYFTNQVLFLSGGNDNYRIPTIVITNNGTLVAICNDRVYTPNDAAKVKYLSMRRSTDGGLTWTKVKNIASADYYSQDIGTAVYDKEQNKIVLLFARTAADPRAVAGQTKGWHTLTSYDNGETWSEKAISIGSNEYDLRGAPYGAGPGIQLTEGKYAGRLVLGARVKATASNGITPGEYNTVLYSDDHGSTWHTGGLVQYNTSECDICEMPGGVIYLNSRCLNGDGKRRVAYSYDGGKTFTDFGSAEDISEPIHGCSGSVIRVENPYEKGQYITLYSNVNNFNIKVKNYDQNRRKISVWLSYDDGKTWPVCKQIFKYQSAYSALQYDEVTGLFYILYENGSDFGSPGFLAYSRGISIATFSLEWLLSDENASDVPITVAKNVNSWYFKAAEKFSAGNGSAEKPYIISNAEELALLSKLVDMGYTMEGIYFELGNDISLQGAEWYPIGNVLMANSVNIDPVIAKTPFSGHFDGKGHTIGQLTYSAFNCRAAGLFGYVLGGEIKNVYLKGTLSEADKTSGIVGIIDNSDALRSKITNCFYDGKLTYIVNEENEKIQGLFRVEYSTSESDPYAEKPDLEIFGGKVGEKFTDLAPTVAK